MIKVKNVQPQNDQHHGADHQVLLMNSSLLTIMEESLKAAEISAIIRRFYTERSFE